MRTTEIPRDQWMRSLDAFSTQHAGWIAMLEVVGAEIGDQEVANGLPLVGIAADVKDGENRIAIILGGRPDAHQTHVVETPRRVWLEEADEPARDAVAIEAADGTTTIVRFRYVPPERIDQQLPDH